MTPTVRIDAICAAARARMDLVGYAPHLVFAEIFFMTDAEVAELHELKLQLIKAGANAASDAAQRIREKHAALRSWHWKGIAA